MAGRQFVCAHGERMASHPVASRSSIVKTYNRFIVGIDSFKFQVRSEGWYLFMHGFPAPSFSERSMLGFNANVTVEPFKVLKREVMIQVANPPSSDVTH